MASESTSENVVKEEERAPPSPASSKLKLPSAFSRLNPAKIFNRKKSGTDIGAHQEATMEGSFQAVEQVSEKIIGSMTHETPLEHNNDEDGKSSEEPKKHHNWGEKLSEKVEKTKDAFKHEVKEGMEKVEATIDTTLKDIMTFVNRDHHKSNEDDATNEASQEATSKIPEQVKDEQVDISETSPLKHNEGTSKENVEEENKKEEKIEKEDHCASSLAQGLQKICAPWSSNKED